MQAVTMHRCLSAVYVHIHVSITACQTSHVTGSTSENLGDACTSMLPTYTLWQFKKENINSPGRGRTEFSQRCAPKSSEESAPSQ